MSRLFPGVSSNAASRCKRVSVQAVFQDTFSVRDALAIALHEADVSYDAILREADREEEWPEITDYAADDAAKHTLNWLEPHGLVTPRISDTESSEPSSKLCDRDSQDDADKSYADSHDYGQGTAFLLLKSERKPSPRSCNFQCPQSRLGRA